MVSDDEQRLLEQICADPHDVQLRSVYADLLIARGDVERGEYTALGVEWLQERLYPERGERYSVLRKNEPRWTAELGLADAGKVRWEGGLPSLIDTTSDLVLQHAEAINRLPIAELHFWHGVRDVAKLVAMPAFARVERLVIGGYSGRIPDHEIAALAAPLPALREISFASNAVGDGGAAALGTAPWVPQLQKLSIDHGLTGAGLARMLRGRDLPRLRELSFVNTSLGDHGGRALADCALPVLERLVFASAGLGAGAAHLFASRALAKVRTLIIQTDDLGSTIAALGRSEHVRELRNLELRGCKIDDAGAAALASTQGLLGLEKLDLAHNELGREGAIALANGLPALRKLSLSDNPFATGTTHYTEFAEDSDGVSGWYPDRVPFDQILALFAHRPGLAVT